MKAPKGTTNRSGIYRITCIFTGKVYIGSAINIGGRIRGHLFDLKNNMHHNRYLQRAWNKHGADDFKAEVVEFCQKSYLLIEEQKHIDSHRSVQPTGFNLNPIARSSLGLKRSPEQIAKMRAANLGKITPIEVREKISSALKIVAKDRRLPRWVIERAAEFNRGRKLPAEQRAKMSAARKGKPRPPEMMKALADFNRGKKRPAETILKMSIGSKLAWQKRRNIKT